MLLARLLTTRIRAAFHCRRSGTQFNTILPTVLWRGIGASPYSCFWAPATSSAAIRPLSPFSVITIDCWKIKRKKTLSMKYIFSYKKCFSLPYILTHNQEPINLMGSWHNLLRNNSYFFKPTQRNVQSFEWKASKGSFFGGPISFKITQTKEKETRKGKSGRKKGGEEKKAMVAVLMFNMANREKQSG